MENPNMIGGAEVGHRHRLHWASAKDDKTLDDLPNLLPPSELDV